MSRTVKIIFSSLEDDSCSDTISIWRDITLEQLYNVICTVVGYKDFDVIALFSKYGIRNINVRRIGKPYNPTATVFYDHISVYDVDFISV